MENEPAVVARTLGDFFSGHRALDVAWTMAKEGRRTAVVERKYIGGSCPNVVCLPSKNIIY
jgi:pyruvate/2-oxoglutarate dehydrogenase complex dihydrolipoamide dehydrogenase (E3) component